MEKKEVQAVEIILYLLSVIAKGIENEDCGIELLML